MKSKCTDSRLGNRRDDHGGSVEDLLAEDDYGDLYEEEADADEAPTADDGEQGAAKEGSSGAGAPGSHEQVCVHCAIQLFLQIDPWIACNAAWLGSAWHMHLFICCLFIQ